MAMVRSRIKNLEEKIGEKGMRYALAFLTPDGMNYTIEVIKNGEVIGRINPDSKKGQELMKKDMVELPKFVIDI